MEHANGALYELAGNRVHFERGKFMWQMIRDPEPPSGTQEN